MAFATGGRGWLLRENLKVIGYYMDAADDFYKAGFEVFKPSRAAKAGDHPRRRRTGNCAGADRSG